MAQRKYRSNYSIENIAQSIARDSDVGKKYDEAEKKRLYHERLRLLENYPELLQILSLDRIRSYPISWAKNLARMALVPPEVVVVDSRIQDMCSLPFWTYYGAGAGSFGRCAGVGAFSCCPPFNLPAEKVRLKLDKSDVLLVMQTSLFAGIVDSEKSSSVVGICFPVDAPGREQPGKKSKGGSLVSNVVDMSEIWFIRL